MEIVSLHPVSEDVLSTYVQSLPTALIDRAAAGRAHAVNQLSSGLAQSFSGQSPSFAARPFGLSFWEAQIDRSIGMTLRPPGRLFIEAGLDRKLVHSMPIRLEVEAGTMAGAWMPARLVPTALAGFDEHLERSARRLVEAELDPLLMLELMWSALNHAQERGVGLLEAQDLVVPGMVISGAKVHGPDPQRLPEHLRQRIEQATTPTKKAGLLDRLLRRVDVSAPRSTNGYVSDVTYVEQHERPDAPQ
jgi:hypothetical protein